MDVPSHEGQLDTMDMECIRRISYVSLLQHHTNTDIRDRAQSPVSLSEACRQHRLRYYGHLCCIPKVALWNEAPGARRPGHPCGSWLDMFTSDAATRGLTRADLALLSHDRDQYREEVVLPRPGRRTPTAEPLPFLGPGR